MRRLLLYAVVVCVSVPITFAAARYIPPVFHHPVWYDGEYSINKVHSFDPWDSEKYISWDEYMDALAGRVNQMLKMMTENNKQAGLMRVKAAPGKTNPAIAVGKITEEMVAIELNNSMNLRTNFWKFYLQGGNLKGHLRDEGHTLEGYGGYIWHAQNTFVQFWYYYGIPSAILFAVVSIILIVISIKKMTRGNEEALICLLYIVFWVMYGLTECVWYPGQMVLFLAFFAPKFLQQNETAKPDEN